MPNLRPLCLIALVSAPLLGGCVSQGEYDSTATSARSLESQLQECQDRSSDLLASIGMKDDALSQKDAQIRALEEQLGEKDNLLAQVGEVDARYAELEASLRNLPMGGLDPRTEQALRRLAQRYPDLVYFDASTGTVRFTSDLTFASGSATVKDGAKAGLRSLADTLMSQDGGAYDMRVTGHTDSQQIANPQTKAKFQNNRILSMYRAYAVSEALQGFGVPAARIETAGWGQYRPLVPNAPDGNTPANRRVEIQLVPASNAIPSAPSAGGSRSNSNSAPADPPSRRESFPIK